MTTEWVPLRGKCSNLMLRGQQLVWWDYANSFSSRLSVECSECGLPVDGVLVERRDHAGAGARCADCWRRDGATDR